MLTWVLSFRPDQIRLLMDIYTVYAKNPNKCFICLGAPWRFFLINSIMNFYVLNGNPMKRKQMKYFCDFEKKEFSMFVFLLLNLKKPNFNAISINLIKSTCITLYSCYKSRNVSSKSLLEIQCNLWNTILHEQQILLNQIKGIKMKYHIRKSDLHFIDKYVFYICRLLH